MWEIETTDIFDEWYDALDSSDRGNVLASLLLLQTRGPMLPRPYADSVYGSRHNNMKELRIQSKGKPLRAFFAFDPERRGVILCAGDKAKDSKGFYQKMMGIADKEFDKHLIKLKRGQKHGKNT